MKITITEIKYSLGGLNSTFEQTEERIWNQINCYYLVWGAEGKQNEGKLTAQETCRRPSRIQHMYNRSSRKEGREREIEGFFAEIMAKISQFWWEY